jgi:hypothetical protein
MAGASGGGRYEVPAILLGWHEDWPTWLDRVQDRSWRHIVDGHGPDSVSGKPRFRRDTDIAYAVFDTITRGARVVDSSDDRIHEFVVNAQCVWVVMHFNGQRWFVTTAYPHE